MSEGNFLAKHYIPTKLHFFLWKAILDADSYADKNINCRKQNGILPKEGDRAAGEDIPSQTDHYYWHSKEGLRISTYNNWQPPCVY